MLNTFEGPASVSVIARYLGRPAVELTTLDCLVRVCNAGPGRLRVELQRYLQGPKDANYLRVVQPGGLMVQGPIVDGCNETTGGWLLIDVEQDLALQPSANGSGWKWE